MTVLKFVLIVSADCFKDKTVKRLVTMGGLGYLLDYETQTHRPDDCDHRHID